MRCIYPRQVSAFFSGNSAGSGDRTVPFFSGSFLLSSGGTSFPGPPLTLDGEHSGPP
jgi:hypothetical protein